MAKLLKSSDTALLCYSGFPIFVDLLCVTADGKHAFGYCTKTNLFQHMDLVNGKQTQMKTEKRPTINAGRELNSACKAILHCTKSSQTFIITIIKEVDSGKCFLASYSIAENNMANFIHEHFVGLVDNIQDGHINRYSILQDDQGHCYFVQSEVACTNYDGRIYRFTVAEFEVDNNGCLTSKVLLQDYEIRLSFHFYHFFHGGRYNFCEFLFDGFYLHKLDFQAAEPLKSTIVCKLTAQQQEIRTSGAFSRGANIDDIYFFFDFDRSNTDERIFYFDLKDICWNTLNIDWYQKDHMIHCSSLHSDLNGRLILSGPCKNKFCSNSARTHLYIIDVNFLRRKLPSEPDKNAQSGKLPRFVPGEYEKQDKLGTGCFGAVFKCFDVKQHRLFAAKEIICDQDEDLKLGHEEAEKLQKLDHPRITDYYGCKIESNKIIIFMEYMAAGSLFQIITKYGAVEEKIAKPYIQQVLDGLTFIHDKGIVHSDLKCANLLLDGLGGLKLGDFGIAVQKLLNTANNSAFTHLVQCGGTLYWMAHELLRDQGEGGSRRIDIWSLGCTIVEMLTGKPPYAKLSGIMFSGAVYTKSLTYDPNELTPMASSEMKDFLTCLLQMDPMKRPHTGADATQKFEQIFG